MTYTGGHSKDCGYHLDQYDHECTCGVSMTQKGEAVGMVELVAASIFATYAKFPGAQEWAVGTSWGDVLRWAETSEAAAAVVDLARAEARAAIEAMLEPTEEMVNATDCGFGLGDWKSMVRAALKETP